MNSDPTPILNDPERLTVLERSGLLDAAPIAAFDRLTQLATKVLRAPVALVSLVDADRQFFVSSVGLTEPLISVRQTPLSHSFCQHVVTADEPLVITDARLHPILRDNLAIPDLRVIAYAGFPLRTATGQVLGSFCVIDHQPRHWTPEELAILKDLAASATTEIELRLALRAARDAQAEAERARHDLYQTFTEAPAMIASFAGPEHIFRFANRAYARGIDCAAGTLTGQPVRNALLALTGHDFLAMLDRIYHSGEVIAGMEARLLLGPSAASIEEQRTFSFVYQPTRDPLGAIDGVLVHATDITEQVQARNDAQALSQQVAAERDQLQQVLDVLPEGVVLADAQARLILTNAAARAILGTQEIRDAPAVDERVATARYATRHPDGRPYGPEEGLLHRAVFKGEVIQGEQMLVRYGGDGREVALLVSAAPLRDETGAISGGAMAFQDISAMKDVERQKDLFLASVSHDLKNPLTAILGMGQLLLRRAGRLPETDGTPFAEGLRTIILSVHGMTAQIGDLLDVTRLQMARPLDLDLQQIDLVTLVNRVIRQYEATTERHTLSLRTALPAILCLCDAGRLERILANLLSNAIKYSPDGDAVVIGLDCPTEDWVRLRVVDEGVGIPLEEQPRIFERFYRASNVTGQIAGTGLGLAGVRSIVEQHGGTIEIDSTPGAGTTVIVRLPLAGPSMTATDSRRP